MSVWEFIGWLIAVPLGLMTALFVYAVSVAVVRVTVKRRQSETSAKRHLRAVK
jgi:ABC-type phosphate transport system permease subunit